MLRVSGVILIFESLCGIFALSSVIDEWVFATWMSSKVRSHVVYILSHDNPAGFLGAMFLDFFESVSLDSRGWFCAALALSAAFYFATVQFACL